MLMMIRFFDLLFAFLLLLLALPFLIILGLIIKIDSKGPIFFRQNRVGRGRKTFRIYKFRSMYTDPARFTGTLAGNEDKKMTGEELKQLRNSFTTATGHDRRITRVGRVLRKTSLDELPQLINVLNGDMSLVGPRPDTPIQEMDYLPEQWEERHTVRPGITGWAQINGRSVTTLENRINCDLYWVRRISPALYLGILFKTVWQVLFRSGQTN